MEIKKLCGISALVLVLATCYKPHQSESIVSKKYEPQRTYQSIGIIEKNGIRRSVLKTFIDDEDCIFKLSSSKEIYVDKKTFDLFKVGNTIDLNKIHYEESDPDIENGN